MDFKDIVAKRYATKKFNGKKLEDKLVNELLEFIRLAPSSFNIQPWKIKVITDDATKQKLLPLSWNQHQITSCSHLLVFCANTDLDSLINLLEKGLSKSVPEEQLSGYVKLMRGFASGMDNEAKLCWAQKQVYIALANAINGAKALGFDSCPMEGFDPKGYSQVLGLPSNLVPSVVCPIGYADDIPKPKFRFNASDIFF